MELINEILPTLPMKSSNELSHVFENTLANNGPLSLAGVPPLVFSKVLLLFFFFFI